MHSSHLPRLLAVLSLALPLCVSAQVHVDQPGDFTITNDIAPAGLGTGDTVTWKPSTPDEVTGLVFGTNAFDSIQAAVDAAPIGATVLIAAGTYAEGSEIILAKSVTLQGDGEALTSLSGADTHRVVNVTAPVGTEVTIRDLSVIDGRTNEPRGGGGISNSISATEGSTLTLDKVTLSGNSTPSGGGGGIVNNGFLTIRDSTISGNTSESGGGLANQAGTVTASGSRFTGNSATNGSGGAIRNFSSGGDRGSPLNAASLTLNDCVVSDNATSSGVNGLGGGIRNGSDSNLVISHSTFSGNTASGAITGSGGGIDNAGSLTVSHSTFAANTALTRGGGITHVGTEGSLTVRNCTFSGNSATGSGSTDGGGLSVINSNNATIDHSTFIGNNAPNGGGVASIVISVSTPPLFRNCIIAGNSATTGGPDVSGEFISEGVNFIGDPAGSTRSGAGTELTFASTATTLSDLLDPTLADNGGTTLTHALVPGSPAIDAGDNSATPADLLTDQRGIARILGAAVDLGAVESLPPLVVPPTSVNFSVDISTKISIRDLVRSITGGTGAPVSLVSVGETANPGASVRIANGFIVYTPARSQTTADSFTFTANDGSQSVEGTIQVQPGGNGTAPTVNIISVALSGGTATIRAAGVPGVIYVLESSENMSTWAPLGSPVVCPAAGIMSFTDPGPLPTSRFYRLVDPRQ